MMHVLPVVASAMSLFSAASGLALAQLPDGQNFDLFAYGAGLGGIQLCAKDGAAYLVDTSKVDIAKTGTEPVRFTKQGQTWLASTNGTTSSTKLDMAQLYVPRSNSESRAIGFLTLNATAGQVDKAETKGFDFYGKLALHIDQQSGALQTAFYAQSTGQEGVKALVWNVTVSNGGQNEQIELRSVPPSKDTAATPPKTSPLRK
ncbi:hypothetical protein RB595_000312 [Gaeumannomyces hyphopodioides]